MSNRNSGDKNFSHFIMVLFRKNFPFQIDDLKNLFEKTKKNLKNNRQKFHFLLLLKEIIKKINSLNQKEVDALTAILKIIEDPTKIFYTKNSLILRTTLLKKASF